MLQEKILRKCNEYHHRLENWMVDRRLLPTHQNYQKFAIICNIRTGSTMLCSLLSSHAQALCFFELFHRHLESIPFSLPGYQAKSNHPQIVHLRNTDPVSFLKSEIYKPQKKSIQAVGFKLLYPQARADNPWWNSASFDRWWKDVGREPSWSGARSDLWAYLQKNTDIAIIHLKRENLLESKISAVMAQRTGNWGVGATGGFGQGQQAIQFELDFQECLQDFEAHHRMESEADEFFKNHRKLSITYEDLVRNTIDTSRRIQEFLGLELRVLGTQTKKQITQPLPDLVTNYHQLKAKFANTIWQDYFKDEF
ncbi:MAG: sulfotransferase [Elainella sp. Prado103]|jgi:LPS sulfotransferase NodH|nr:sulfotransferase [Elainella sp. Prado103]